MDAHIKHGHYLYKSTKSKVAADTLNSVIPNVVIKAQKPRPPAGGVKCYDGQPIRRKVSSV